MSLAAPTRALRCGSAVLLAFVLVPVQAPPFRTQTDLVALSITVLDQHDRLVEGLAQEAFTITEDGQPRTISHFSAATAPLSLVIAVDASESMRGARFEFAKHAVEQFFEAMGPEDEISVIGFNDRVFSVAPWARSLSAIQLGMDRVQPIGTTALYAAVVDAVDALRSSRHRRQAVVVISDGNDYLESDLAERGASVPPRTLRAMRAAQRLERSEALLYAIGVDAPVAGAAASSNAFDANALRKLTEPTGGFTIVVRHDEGVPDAAARIASELGRQYVIGFAPAHTADGKFHRLRVTVSGCARCRVRARAGFTADQR